MFALARFRGVLAGVIVLVAVVSVTASASGGGARAGTSVTKLRPHTVLVAPTRWGISGLRADGPRLVWLTDQRRGKNLRPVIQVFDRRTGRLTTMRLDPGAGNWYEPEGIASLELAGKRLLGSRYYEGSDAFGSDAFTALIGDRRLRRVALFSIGEYSAFDALRSRYYTVPIRIAAGGGAVGFFGVESYEEEDGGESQAVGVWGLQGGQARRLPYEPPLLASIAVDGPRLATLEFVTTGSDSQPAVSPDGREIAWVRDSSEIWLMKAAGSDQRRLFGDSAANSPYVSDPIWSPDGTALAFRNGSAIELIGRDGSNQRRLVGGYRPVWSPDGTTLAFVRDSDDWLVAADGSGVRRLSGDGGERGRPAWSPDGKTLAVARDRGLYLIDVASGNAHNLTPGIEVARLAWSPDGTWIAFAAGDASEEENGDLATYLIRPDGSDLHTIMTGWSRWPYSLAWSPDGTRIAYRTATCDLQKAQRSVIRVVKADGSGETTLQHHNPCLTEPVWSPDGRTIVAGDEAAAGDPSSYDYSTGGIEALDPDGGPSSWLAPPEQLTAALELRDLNSGKLLRQWQLPWQRPLHRVTGKLLRLYPGASPVRVRRPYGTVALSGRYLLATYWRPGTGPVLERYDTNSGTLLGTTPFPASDPPISLAGSHAVYSLGRRVYLLDAKSGQKSLLTTTPRPAVPIINGNHVLWAENYKKDGRPSSRIREIVLP